MRYFPILAASVVLAASGASNVVANTIINLTQDATVRDAGTYTYYSRATGTDAFTTAFYPGYTASSGYRDGTLAPTPTAGAAISFKTGELTNGTAGSVSSWQGAVSSSGNFDILFDLGGNYIITSVVVTYADFSGYRWIIAANAQQVFVGTQTPTDSNLALFSSATFASGINSTAKTSTFTGAETEARYVDFRGAVTASGSSNNGGVLYQVAINGYAVPESASLGLLIAGGLLILARRAG